MSEPVAPHPRSLRWHCPHCLASFTLLSGVLHCEQLHPNCLFCSAEALLLKALAQAAMGPAEEGGPIVWFTKPTPGQ